MTVDFEMTVNECPKNAGRKTWLAILDSPSVSLKGGNSPQAQAKKLLAKLVMEYPVLAGSLKVVCDPPSGTRIKNRPLDKLNYQLHSGVFDHAIGARFEEVTQDISHEMTWRLMEAGCRLADRRAVTMIPEGLDMQGFLETVRGAVLDYYGLAEPGPDAPENAESTSLSFAEAALC